MAPLFSLSLSMELLLGQPTLSFEHVGDKYLLTEADTPGSVYPSGYHGRWLHLRRRRIKVLCPHLAVTQASAGSHARGGRSHLSLASPYKPTHLLTVIRTAKTPAAQIDIISTKYLRRTGVKLGPISKPLAS